MSARQRIIALCQKTETMALFNSTLADRWGLLVLVTYFSEKQHKQIETYVKEGDDEDL